MFTMWCQLKRGLKDNTFQNYQYMYNTFVRSSFGKHRIQTLRKSDVKRFYNTLADERMLQASTIDSVHTVLHQVLDMAKDLIDVNHTLVYYDHRYSEGKKGCYFGVNTPKTEASCRTVPMLKFVHDAFIEERNNQDALGMSCSVSVDGYTDFIFINRFGATQHQGTINKAIRRIIRDCNDEVLAKGEDDPILLPHFSCHPLRHTFTTRMCEAGVNVKVIQATLGHSDISTTLNIYADVTNEMRTESFKKLDSTVFTVQQ